MVTTVPRVLIRVRARARRILAHRALTAPVAAGLVLFVVLSVPGADTDGPAPSALPAYGVASAPRPADPVPDRDRGERAGYDDHWVAVGPPLSTCDTRSGIRDLPDVLPAPVLSLASWDQPWWPIRPSVNEPVPEQGVSQDLPPTRAPPLTAFPS